MITEFSKLRKHIEPPEGRPLLETLDFKRYALRIEYAKTMAIIQMSQDLYEIKVALKDLRSE